MVKNRAAKQGARVLKDELGITYPRALDLVQSAGNIHRAYPPLQISVSGQPYQPARGSVLILDGASGIGKSGLLARLAADASKADALVYIIDTIKGGADFRGIRKELSGLAVSGAEALAMIGRISASGIPAIVIVDEAADLADQHEVTQALIALNSDGYPLIIATQDMKAVDSGLAAKARTYRLRKPKEDDSAERWKRLGLDSKGEILPERTYRLDHAKTARAFERGSLDRDEKIDALVDQACPGATINYYTDPQTLRFRDVSVMTEDGYHMPMPGWTRDGKRIIPEPGPAGDNARAAISALEECIVAPRKVLTESGMTAIVARPTSVGEYQGVPTYSFSHKGSVYAMIPEGIPNAPVRGAWKPIKKSEYWAAYEDEEDTELEDSLGDRKFVLGTNDNGSTAFWMPRRSPNLMILGAPGAGKTRLLQRLAREAAETGDVYIADLKGELDVTDAAGRAANLSETAAMLEGVLQEYEERKRKCVTEQAATVFDLPKPPRPLIAVLDDAGSMTDGSGESTAGDLKEIRRISVLLGKLARYGRTTGVSLIMGAQKFNHRSIPGGNDFVLNTERLILGPIHPGFEHLTEWSRSVDPRMHGLEPGHRQAVHHGAGMAPSVVDVASS